MSIDALSDVSQCISFLSIPPYFNVNICVNGFLNTVVWVVSKLGIFQIYLLSTKWKHRKCMVKWKDKRGGGPCKVSVRK